MVLSWLVYAAAVIACAAFRAYYIGWFGVFLFRAVVLVPIAAAVLSLPGIFTAEAALSAPQSIRRGRDGKACVRIKGRFPFGSETLHISIGNLFTGAAESISLKSDGGEASFPLPCGKCGVLSVSVSREYRRDLTGLLRIPFKGGAEVRCVVLPQPAPPEPAPDLARLIEARRALRPSPGSYSEEHEVREYRPGDPMRSMHWKLSSKTDRPVVREPQTDTRRRITVELDPAGDIERSLSVIEWVCESLISAELECDLLWRSRSGAKSAHVASGAGLYEALGTLLSEPADGAPQDSGADVRCRFIVKDGEVTAL